MAGLVGPSVPSFGNSEPNRVGCFLQALDRVNDSADKRDIIAFQYFPESLSDTKAVNYQQKEIPGGSLPLYQWVSSGERLISFTAQFSSDMDLIANNNIALNLDLISQKETETRNIDIRSALVWLRRCMFPAYTTPNKLAGHTVQAPRKLLLTIPNSGIGLLGGFSQATTSDIDKVLCVMTQCDITYEQFFDSGLPRIANVSLAFAQIPQRFGEVEFPSTGFAIGEEHVTNTQDTERDKMDRAYRKGFSIDSFTWAGYNPHPGKKDE